MSAGDIRHIVGASRDGRPAEPVVYRAWPAERPAAAVILLHGLGGHSDRFHECGRVWSARGLSLYAPDLPGFGHTEGPKGHLDSFDPIFAMVDRLVAQVMAENSRRPVFIP